LTGDAKLKKVIAINIASSVACFMSLLRLEKLISNIIELILKKRIKMPCSMFTHGREVDDVVTKLAGMVVVKKIGGCHFF
jgi:hypothetical protein